MWGEVDLHLIWRLTDVGIVVRVIRRTRRKLTNEVRWRLFFSVKTIRLRFFDTWDSRQWQVSSGYLILDSQHFFKIFPELSDVLWTMVFRKAFMLSGYAGAVATYALFFVFAFLSFSILVLMEGLSAFLHALRLHWYVFFLVLVSGKILSFSIV